MIKTIIAYQGSRQYKLKPNQCFVIDGKHDLNQNCVLPCMILDQTGKVTTGQVISVPIKHITEKTSIIKHKRRKHHMKRIGSKHHFSVVRVLSIEEAKIQEDN